MRCALPSALLLGLIASLPAHALDFGSVASGIANVAGALNGQQNNNSATAQAVNTNADCQKAVAQNQDKIELVQAIGKVTGNQKITDGAARAQNGCGELMAGTAVTNTGAEPTSGTANQIDAAANGLKALGGLFGK